MKAKLKLSHNLQEKVILRLVFLRVVKLVLLVSLFFSKWVDDIIVLKPDRDLIRQH